MRRLIPLVAVCLLPQVGSTVRAQQLVKLQGHVTSVTVLALQPGGDLLACGCGDGQVWLWDVKAGQAVRTLDGHRTQLRSLAFSPDGKLLATAAFRDSGQFGLERKPVSPGEVIVWEVATGKAVLTIKPPADSKGIQALAFTPDGKRLAGCSLPGGLPRQDPDTGQYLQTWTAILVWELPGGEQTRHELKSTLSPETLVFQGQQHFLMTERSSRPYRCDLKSGEVKPILERTPGVASSAVSLSPDGKRLLLHGQSPALHDLDSGREQPLEGRFVNASAWSAAGDLVAGRTPQGIIVWETATGSKKHTVAVKPTDGIDSAMALERGRLAYRLNSEVVVHDLVAEKELFRTPTLPPRPSLHRSGDGRRIVLAGDVVTVWDGRTGKPLGRFRPHTTAAVKVVLSQDGSRLVTAARQPAQGPPGKYQTEIKVWGLADSKEQAALPLQPGTDLDLALSPDGRLLAATGTEGGILWDLEKGKEIRPLPPGTLVVFTPDGKALVVAFSKGTGLDGPGRFVSAGIRVIEVEGGKERHHFERLDGPVVCVRTDGETKELWALLGPASPYSTNATSALRHWDLVSGKASPPVSMALKSTPQAELTGARLLVKAERGTDIWDARAGVLLRPLTVAGTAWQAAPDGRSVFALVGNTVHQVPLTTPLLRFAQDLKVPVASLAWSPDGTRLAIGAHDNSLRVWDEQGQEQFAAKDLGGPPLALSFGSDGRLAAGCGEVGGNGALRIWGKDGKELAGLRAHGATVNGLAFGSEQQLISAGDDGRVQIQDLRPAPPTSPRNPVVLPRERQAIRGLALSPDGKRLACGSYGIVKVWDLASRKEVVVCRGATGFIHSVAFSPDGKRLAATSADWTVRVWEADTGKRQHTLTGPSGTVRSLAFDREGRWLLAASGEVQRPGEVHAWDVASGKGELLLRSHTGPIHALAIAPDGKRLATAGQDGTVKLWDLTDFLAPPGR